MYRDLNAKDIENAEYEVRKERAEKFRKEKKIGEFKE